MNKVFIAFGLIFLGFLTLAGGVWAVLALFYSGPNSEILRSILAIVLAVASLSTIIALGFSHWRWRAFSAYAVLFIAVLIWYFSLTPSNDRQWQEDVAALPYATLKENIVTVHNIRNFDYRSEMEYSPAYYDKAFDLDKLEGVDLIAVYWMGPSIAHIFLSFAFTGDNHLAISIETRKEKGESYSTLKGFFRQYELYYVVADERDVIGLRTNYRQNPPEDVYVYRTKGPIENGKQLFLEYMHQINRLKEKPEFYNTLTTNCTTNIWMNSLVNATHLPFDWEILVSGYLPSYLYENERLETYGLSFKELKKISYINERAKSIDSNVSFSKAIRTLSLQEKSQIL